MTTKRSGFGRGFQKCMVCDDCHKKYPKIRDGRFVDYQAIEQFGCEVHEGDTNPAHWGYGTPEQIEDANRELASYNQ